MKKQFNKVLLKSFIPFILIQIIMFLVAVFFVGGGHGTSIPLIIFYGPLLIFLKFEIFASHPSIAFVALFLMLFVLFIIVWLGFINKKILSYITTFYILISIGILIFTEFNNLGLGSSTIPLNIKFIAILIAAIISTIFWRIIFGLVGDNNH